jgi:Ca-activated chloride channel homolog
MKKPLCILLLLLLMITAQVIATQTRARRVDPTLPEAFASPSPSPPTGNPEPSRRSREKADPDSEPQEGVDVVRIDTTLVTVPVSVRDRNGRFVPDLGKEDFRIYEDGVEQEIAYFRPTETPFTVVLMLDTSASTWSKLGQIKDAAKSFVSELRPDDQVMVIAFGMGVKVHCEPTSDRRKIGEAIADVSRGLSTHLYDAMDKLMKKYLDRIQGRKAVVLFTDGVDATSNHATYDGTLRIAQELDALIYPILYDTYDPAADTGGVVQPQSSPHLPWILRKLPLPIPTIGAGGSSGGGAGSTRADYDRGERYLHDLAESTGGRVYEASKDLRYLHDAFSQIADELGRQYSIGYYPKRKGQTGELRQIKVRVSRMELTVRARDKYVYKGAGDVGPKAENASEKQTNPAPSPPVLQKTPFVRSAKARGD